MSYQDSLQMTHRYPFDCQPSSGQTISYVKLARKFQEHQHLQLRTKIERHSSIQHPCLIKIVKAFESKKKRYFDIMFQWIKLSFRNYARYLSHSELDQQKRVLVDLCRHLIGQGIHPIIAEDMLGFTQQRRIKLYVDVDFSPAMGSAQELVKAKEIEISNIFRLHDRISLTEMKHSPRQSMHDILGRQEQSHTKVVMHYQKVLSPQHQHQLIESKSITNCAGTDSTRLQRSLSNQMIFPFTSPAESGGQPSNSHQPLEAFLTKAANTFIQLRSQPSAIQQERHAESCKMSVNSSQQKSGSNIMKPTKDVTPPETIKVESVIQRHQLKRQEPPALSRGQQESRQTKHEMMRQPRAFKPAHSKSQQEQDQQQVSVVDTYREELGQMRKMPKIQSTQFRQTTNEPSTKSKAKAEKSRMSTGNSNQNPNGCKLSLFKLNQEKQVPSDNEQPSKQSRKSKVESSYYYREAFGFGFQKNDPLTREFINLLQGQQQHAIEESQRQQSPHGPSDPYPEDQGYQPRNNLDQINQKMKQAMKNTKRALEMFGKYKLTKK